MTSEERANLTRELAALVELMNSLWEASRRNYWPMDYDDFKIGNRIKELKLLLFGERK